jgi:acyl-CoA reductase-like NAD-dependent aldehyde dehydrogenase
LSDRQVDLIATRLAGRLAPGAAPRAAPAPARTAQSLGVGIFATVDDAVQAATIAQRRLDGMTLAGREAIIASIREAMLESAEELARHAHQETGLGRPEDKVVKNRLVTRKTAGTEVLVPHAVTGDSGLTLTEYAPYGVIGAITPTTNPTSTIICNTIAMVSAGNSVVFNVHPNARECSMANIRLLHRAIVRAGGPANLVCAVAEPTIESAQELMRHRGIRLLVVTGGIGVVRAAMQSGKRAICAGPGNPPVVVDATADLELAGRQFVAGASFDNNIVCTDEKEVIAVESVADELVRQMGRHGAYVLDGAELRKVERLFFAEERGRLVVLDRTGTAWSSDELARRLARWREEGLDTILVIGGDWGLDPGLVAEARFRWSLGPLTLPHELARVVTLEQWYRAWTIIRGEPYHRGA